MVDPFSQLIERHVAGRPSLPDAIANALREAVAFGTVAPGARLHQDDLARRFGVSRIPVREALQKLVVEGLAVQLPNKGIRVAPTTETDFRDITEQRILLEPHALRLSAPRLTEADFREAERLLALGRPAWGTPEAPALHWRFHATLYSRADRPRLLAQIDALHRAISRYMMPAWYSVGLVEDWDEDHAEILRAVRRGDIDAAAGLTVAQIEAAAARVLGRIARDGNDTKQGGDIR